MTFAEAASRSTAGRGVAAAVNGQEFVEIVKVALHRKHVAIAPIITVTATITIDRAAGGTRCRRRVQLHMCQIVEGRLSPYDTATFFRE